MSASYIPAQDAGLDTWSQNFAALITAAPATYGLDATAALAIQTAVDAYHDAYLLGGLTAPPNPVPVNPSTRTPVTVAAKDSAKFAMRALARTYAAQIRLNPGVSNADKLALGLNLPNNSPSPIPTPTSFPMLTFLLAGPLTHQFSYKDSDTPVGKLKPTGAIQGLLFAMTSTTPVVDPTLLPFKQAFTKSPFLVQWDSADAGELAYYAAYWQTRRGLVGPWSAIQSVTVVAA